MSSTSTPASNETTLYGQIPTYLVARPYYTIASSASAAVSSTAFASANDALNTSLLTKCVDTFKALGIWATS